MHRINYWAVVVAAIAAFVMSAVWYSPLLFGKVWMELRGMNPTDVKMSAGMMIGEFVRTLVIAYVFARFLLLLGVFDWKGAFQLGLWVWIGFWAMVLLGSVLHENMPWKLYVIHAGDGLVKILLMASILGLWYR